MCRAFTRVTSFLASYCVVNVYAVYTYLLLIYAYYTLAFDSIQFLLMKKIYCDPEIC